MNKMTMAELRQLIIDLMDYYELEYDENGKWTGRFRISNTNKKE